MKMTYQQAERIRSKSFGSLLGEQEGGLGTSLKKTLSIKGKARMTGIKEKFDPLNIAKFLTGGSNFAPAALGKLFGRSREDIARFSGSRLKDLNSPTATKIDSLQSENETLDMLMKIYEFMQKSYNDKIEKRNTENSLAEEKEMEKNRRHKELIAAITGKPIESKQTAEKEKPADAGNSMVDDILGMFGLKDLAKATIKSVGSLARLAMGASGILLGGAAAAGIAYFMYKVLTDKSSYEGEDSPLNKALKQAEAVGGLAGVKDEADRRKKLPEYERTMLELKDAETTFWKDLDDIPQKGTDAQLKGYAERSPEAKRAVEDYKKERDTGKVSPAENKVSDGKAINQETGEEYAPLSATTPNASPTESSVNKETTSDTPTATNVPTAVPAPKTAMAVSTASSSASTMDTSSAIESTPSSDVVNKVIAQNLDMNLPINENIKSNDLVNNTITNNIVSSQNKIQQDVKPIPSVRNMEETFKRMMLYSTHVV